MPVCMMHAMHVKMPTEPEKSIGFPGTEAVSSYKPPGTRTVTTIVVLCKNCKHCNSSVLFPDTEKKYYFKKSYFGTRDMTV